MLDLLKCPCCGNSPEVHKWDIGCYYVSCTRYACNFPYLIIGGSKTDAIRAWNEDVKKYKKE